MNQLITALGYGLGYAFIIGLVLTFFGFLVAFTGPWALLLAPVLIWANWPRK